MKKTIALILSLILCVSIFAPASSALSINASPKALFEQFKDGISPDGADYVYFSPVKNSADTQKYPLLIWLHGAEAGFEEREQIAYYEEWKLASDEYQAKFPGGGLFVFAPRNQGTMDTGWDSGDTQALKARIDAFVEKYKANIDTDRIYVAGYSGGGSIIWNLLNVFPTYFAAAVPIAALVQPTLYMLERMTDISIWMFSSDADTILTARSSYVKSNFTSLKALTNRPESVRITTFSKAVMPDGKVKGGDSPTLDSGRCIWYSFTNDMHMYDGSPYAYQTTLDAAGNEFEFRDGSGVLSWLAAQTRSGVDPEDLDESMVPAKIAQFLRLLLDRLFAIIFSIFNPAAFGQLTNPIKDEA